MNETTRVEPSTPEERQATLTVQSARHVVREIDNLRRQLTDGEQPPDKRRQAKRDLVNASERLCNLLALAVYQITYSVHGELQGRLEAALDDLRGRLLDMGTNLMIEKLRKIHQVAEAVLKDGGYPLGLATKLDHAFSAIIGNLATLGAMKRLAADDRRLIDETDAEIKSLAEIEDRLGVLAELDRHRPKAKPVAARPMPVDAAPAAAD